MGARRFAPGSGRFLQRDVYHNAGADFGLTSDALNQNRYALAAGNPVGYVETDGNAVIDDGGGGSTITPIPPPPPPPINERRDSGLVEGDGPGEGGGGGGGSGGAQAEAEMAEAAMIQRQPSTQAKTTSSCS